MAVTTRRAGKTTACALDLIQQALGCPRAVNVYITLTRSNSKSIVWPMLKQIIRENEINCRINESELKIFFHNGAVIWAAGCDTHSDVDKFRGQAYRTCYIDEAQSFPEYLEELINDALSPGCIDYDGKIRVIGTPGPVPVGQYYDMYNSASWSHHFWTLHDNPFLTKATGKTAREWIEEEMRLRGVDENHPTIRREFFGEFVVDSRNLVIDYDATRNHFDIPPGNLKYILGIDIGFEDADAIAVIGHTDASSTTYLVDESLATKQGLTDLVQQIETLRDKYKPYKLIIDEGGLGKKLAEEIRRRYRIPVHPADKKRKFENIEILNDCLRTKRFMARKTSRFANESRLLEWDFDKFTPDRKVVSDRFHSDIIDAVLYGFKESPAFSWEPPQVRPAVGTPAWGKEQEKEMFEKALDHFNKQDQLQHEGLEWL